MASVNFKKTTRVKFDAKIESNTLDNNVFYRVVNTDGTEDLYFGSKKLNNAADIEAALKDVIDAIEILNSDVTVEGSVKKQVSDAVAKIVADAPEAYDTLKEISDWISDHTDSASTMNTQIINNMNAIAEINKLLGTSIPEDSNATNLIEYITEVINTAVNNLDSTISATDGAVLTGITIENGLITDKAEKVLGTAATKNVEDFDTAGSAAAILGSETDGVGTNTIYGLKAAINEIDNVLTWDDLTDETIE